jgi:hypothetical protein
MPYHSYQLFQTGRPMSTADQRAADARNGELAAAISRQVTATGAQIRAVVQRRTRNPYRASRAQPPQQPRTGQAALRGRRAEGMQLDEGRRNRCSAPGFGGQS